MHVAFCKPKYLKGEIHISASDQKFCTPEHTPSVPYLALATNDFLVQDRKSLQTCS